MTMINYCKNILRLIVESWSIREKVFLFLKYFELFNGLENVRRFLCFSLHGAAYREIQRFLLSVVSEIHLNKKLS